MANSARGSATGSIEIVTFVDKGDDSLESIQHAWDVMLRGPRQTLSRCWNDLARIAHGDILMMCGDDTIFRTPGWDRIVEDAFAACPDKILMVHGDDGSPADQNRFATLPFLSRRWVETTGRFTGEWFPGDFSDSWINDIANDLGRRQHVPILIEHMHPYWNKGQMDEVYREKYARDHDANAARLYLAHANERNEDREKLRAVMDASWTVPLLAKTA